jgi:ATP-dependent RNA helicase DeaD
MALFSATMPKEVERIARRHLHDPQEISIESRAATAETIRQRYWLVGGMHKLDALTRILEVEPHDGILIFVRTRIATSELAGRLEARGYAAAAMNGDMPQNQREQMVARLKGGSLDILVATDVAARGLDVDRISHVINYDIPYDTEAYIHRIGRTGRAGRQGDAILFVAPRERRMLHAIEQATRQKIEPLELPTTETVNNKRIADFKQRIGDTLAAGDLAFMQSVVEQYQQDHDVPALEIAAALANMSIGDRPLLLDPAEEARARRSENKSRRAEPKHGRRDRPNARQSDKRSDRNPRERNQRPAPSGDEMEQFRIEVGLQHEVETRNIVGAIANEAGVDAEHIGRVDIPTEFSLVELPIGMPKAIFKDLKKVWICGRQLNITRVNEPDAGASVMPARTPRKRVSNRTEPRTPSRRPVSPDARGGKAQPKGKGQPKSKGQSKSNGQSKIKGGKKRKFQQT